MEPLDFDPLEWLDLASGQIHSAGGDGATLRAKAPPRARLNAIGPGSDLSDMDAVYLGWLADDLNYRMIGLPGRWPRNSRN